MSAIRPMTPMDLLKFNPCNLDHLTETYNIGFYLEYFTKWPQLCKVMEGENGQIEAYILGKVEASPYPAPVEPYDPGLKIYQKKFPNYLPWHAHITCLTVAPAARRLGHATVLSKALEEVGDEQNAWFVDLFVRVENEAAIKLYKKMGYSVYRRIVDYYNDGSDAYDMRKPLKRDKQRKTVRANVYANDIQEDPIIMSVSLHEAFVCSSSPAVRAIATYIAGFIHTMMMLGFERPGVIRSQGRTNKFSIH